MKANLIIQMHRIGDLILTFPLVKKMLELEATRPLFIVAEKNFYLPLKRLAPQAIFIPPTSRILLETEFNHIINLSHRKESYELIEKLKSEKITGYYKKNNALHINGFWQLYRASLTHNSRHNLFHWADLNALDILNYNHVNSMTYTAKSTINNDKKIGLFIGASEASKRPDPLFFAKLAESLLKLGYKPFFLGGAAEEKLGEEANKILQIPALNLVNKFTLEELVKFMQTLDLLVTPDTGPMHIAAAFGVPTLNLSLGNVAPNETSVSNQNHYILQANLSCRSCWACRRNYECKDKFAPKEISKVIHSILSDNTDLNFIKDLSLFETARTENLHTLIPIYSTRDELKSHLDNFWQEYFFRISPLDFPHEKKGVHYLKNYTSNIVPLFLNAHLNLFKGVHTSFKKNEILAPDFWNKFPPLMQSISSFIQLFLENNLYSKESYAQAFSFLEEINK